MVVVVVVVVDLDGDGNVEVDATVDAQMIIVSIANIKQPTFVAMLRRDFAAETVVASVLVKGGVHLHVAVRRRLSIDHKSA